MSSYVCLWVCWCKICRAADELQNEAKSHVLNHKNIVALFAMIFERGHYGVVLEFVPLGCLQDFIHRHQVLNYVNYITLLCTYELNICVLISFNYELHFTVQLISAQCLTSLIVLILCSGSLCLNLLMPFFCCALKSLALKWEVREAKVTEIFIGGDTDVDVPLSPGGFGLCHQKPVSAMPKV